MAETELEKQSDRRRQREKDKQRDKLRQEQIDGEGIFLLPG